MDCGKEIYSGCQRCTACYNIFQRRAARPSPIDLAKMIVESNFTAIGKQFGIDANAIKNWCKQYGMPHRTNELRAWYYDKIGEIDPKTIVEEKPKVEKRFVQQIDPITDEVIAVFETTKLAAQAVGRNKGSHIGETCNGKYETFYGYKWRYISESEYNK